MKTKEFLLAFGITSTLIFGNEIPFNVVGEVFDYGPQTTQIVVNFKENLDPNSININSFKILNTSSNERKITGINFLNKDTLVLELEHGQGVKGAGMLYWDNEKFSNIELPIKYSLIQNEDLTTESGKIIKNDEFSYKMESLKIKEVDKFTSGEKYGLQYRDFKPEKNSKKHPLIIWLHGAGEGGESNITQILGNRGGVAFSEESSQKIFDSPYILAPQTPTFWMKSFMVGDRELVGKKDYTPDLVKLIEDYIEKNPDIDRDRVYIGGCSMGGYQTFKTLVHSPNLFAAAFITCPAYEPSKQELDKIKNIPIWLVHASDDTTVSVNNSRNSFNYLKNSGSDVIYTEYKNVQRDGYDYDPHGSYFYTLHNDPVNEKGTHIFQWVASKKRTK